MRTIFKKRQEYYKAINTQKELAEQLKEDKFKDAIKETLKDAMEVKATPVEPNAPVEEKKKPGRKKT